jgi:hypothetical protein
LTLKLSMNDGPSSGPTWMPTSSVPVELKRTSPRRAVAETGTVEFAIGLRVPSPLKRNPV